MMPGNRNVLQMECPLCGNIQDKLFDGHYPKPDGKPNEVIFDLDNGFAFCNCRNIFFNDWKNTEQGVYDEKYSDKYQGEITSKYFQQYFLTYFPLIKKYKHQGRMVEIGCVNKTLLDYFKKMTFETYSLDIIKHEWEGHHNITVDYEKFRTDDKFAVVWASHVFEHFKDPVAAFKSTYEILEEGGVAFIAMPDPYFIDFQHPYSWGHFHLREHHIMWDMDSLCALLKEIGFEIIEAIHNVGTEFICNGDFHVIVRKP